MELENIGNLIINEYEPRIAAPAGLVSEPSLVLKLYTMFKEENGPPSAGLIGGVKKFLKREIKSKDIEPLSGLGFAILSSDMLNVARWDSEHPIVIKNQIYDLGAKPDWALLDVGDIGCFCVWELGIVGHEKEAWKRYLQSNKTIQDKEEYLKDTINKTL